MDVGRDHLIHRKRSPFPYEGKALTRGNLCEIANIAHFCPLPALKNKHPIIEDLLPLSGASLLTIDY